MKTAINYIFFRVFEFFGKHEKGSAKEKTIFFIIILEASLIVPLALTIELISSVNLGEFLPDRASKWLAAVVTFLILYPLNRYCFREHASGKKLEELHERYYRKTYRLPIWIILGLPVYFMFFSPVLYGLITGTLEVFGRPAF